MFFWSVLTIVAICHFAIAEDQLQPGCAHLAADLILTSEPTKGNEAKPTPISTLVYLASTPEHVSVQPLRSSISSNIDPASHFQSFTYVTSTPVYGPSQHSTSTGDAVTTSAPVASLTYTSESSNVLCLLERPCLGDITYYEAGLGACGETTDGSVEKVIALPFGLMGAQSNGNPYCGKTVTIKKGSKTTTATVVDKCMGCIGNSIDLSNAAFLELAELSVGRTTAEWWFN